MTKIGRLLLMLASWCVAACSWAAPDQAVALDSEFTLPVGGTALLAQTGLRLGVESVSEDSRCPKAAQCVWAGQATVRVWLQRGNSDRQTLELHLPALAGPPPRALGMQLSLLRLDPIPVSGKPLAQVDYRATLRLSPEAPAASPER